MTSKFKGILDVAKGAKDREPQPEPAPADPPPPSPAPVEAPKRGRPPGKRSDPSYSQVTAYIPEELHRRVKIVLLQEAKGQEFSELVEELLLAWIESRA
jgi:hypothetical protein